MNSARRVSILLLIFAGIAAARVAAQQPPASAVGPAAVTAPLAKELERCKLLNEKAAQDRRCAAAYEENRRRFFAPMPASHPTKVDFFPGVPDAVTSPGMSHPGQK